MPSSRFECRKDRLSAHERGANNEDGDTDNSPRFGRAYSARFIGCC